jgi:prepilin signal peptidase PulO-like enzyme (type II secretory pathway)
LVLGVVFALAYGVLGIGIPLAVFLVATLLLAFVVLYDVRHTIVPLETTAVLAVLAAGFTWLTLPYLFVQTILLACGIALVFVLLHVFSGGRAMGLGDAPVALALSLLVGAPAAIPGFLFSFWIGALVGIGILVARPGGPTMGIQVPFVPFLAAGYLLAYFTAWNPLPF